MIKNLKMRTKIVLIVLIAVSVSLCVNTVRTYTQISDIFTHSLQTGVNLGLKASNETNIAMTEQAKNDLQRYADLRAREVNENFKQVKIKVSEVADILELGYKNSASPKGSMPPRVRRDLAENEALTGDVIFAKYDLAPGVSLDEKIKRDLIRATEHSDLFNSILKNNKFFDSVYMGMENGGFYIVSKHKTFSVFDARERDWYKAAVKNNGETIWTDSYIDVHGIVMITCAKAFYYPNGQLAGVAAIDVKHSDMIDKLINNDSISNGIEFLLDKKENYISQNSISNADEVWYEALHDMATDKYKSKIVTIDSEDHYLFSSKLEENGWVFGLMIPAKTMSLPIEEVKIKIATQIEQAKQNDRAIFSETLMNFTSGFIFAAILSMIIAIILSISITRPLRKLMRQINFMGKGNLNRIELDGRDEFGELSRAFNKMSDNLRNYIKELEYANAQTEHINNELEIARRIQSDLLPKKVENFSKVENLDFYVRMIAAKEIGGDFYDFFYMDSEKSKMCFVIGDVSGKGIPAAIYMAQAKVLIKTSIMQTQNLALALKNVNKVLSENNEYCMFVTVIALCVDLNSRECIMVNCGHNNPMLSVDGTPYEYLKLNNSMAIGISEESEYEEECLKLSPNDKIYLYTDGAIEAMNNKSELFGKEKLLKCANNNLNAAPKEFDWAIRSEIAAFTSGTPQADDTTTIAIRIM
jgi:sigma-B regulation protein RsbU (phosphoserine phosphatase)